MNKYLKTGLILQIPNVCLIFIISLILLIYQVNWALILVNLPFILIGSTFALINIASLIYVIIGLFK